MSTITYYGPEFDTPEWYKHWNRKCKNGYHLSEEDRKVRNAFSGRKDYNDVRS